MSFFTNIKRVISASPRAAAINLPRHGSTKVHHLYVSFIGTPDPVVISDLDQSELLETFHALKDGMKNKAILVQDFNGTKTVIDCRKITTLRLPDVG